jgi:hypothetical protein
MTSGSVFRRLFGGPSSANEELAICCTSRFVAGVNEVTKCDIESQGLLPGISGELNIKGESFAELCSYCGWRLF